MLVIFFITIFIAPVVYSAGGKEALTVRYVDGQWICADGTVFKLRLIEILEFLLGSFKSQTLW